MITISWFSAENFYKYPPVRARVESCIWS